MVKGGAAVVARVAQKWERRNQDPTEGASKVRKRVSITRSPPEHVGICLGDGEFVLLLRKRIPGCM